MAFSYLQHFCSLIPASGNFENDPQNQQVGTWQIYTHCCCKQQPESKIKARSKEQSHHTFKMCVTSSTEINKNTFSLLGPKRTHFRPTPSGEQCGQLHFAYIINVAHYQWYRGTVVILCPGSVHCLQRHFHTSHKASSSNFHLAAEDQGALTLAKLLPSTVILRVEFCCFHSWFFRGSKQVSLYSDSTGMIKR